MHVIDIIMIISIIMIEHICNPFWSFKKRLKNECDLVPNLFPGETLYLHWIVLGL
jgi:hypothetical protein